jgi:hypothetical protein
LRALAVLLVVAFHADLPIPGGFIGVDVFFVISGFVITSMLVRQLEAGRMSFALLCAPVSAVTSGAGRSDDRHHAVVCSLAEPARFGPSPDSPGGGPDCLKNWFGEKVCDSGRLVAPTSERSPQGAATTHRRTS